MVDVDGSGTIDHGELEEVLRDCGVLKSIAVKRVPKAINTLTAAMEEKKIEEEADKEQKEKKKSSKGKGQPIDPPGMSAQVAEGLASLETRVEELRIVMKDVSENGHQFDLVLEQYNRAKGDDEENTRKALLQAGEELVERMATGIQQYKQLAAETHEFSVNLIHDLPRDYRVVWKAAVCSEIDEKGGLVRALNEEMYERERDHMQMKEECREWRMTCKNAALDLTG